jgi:heptosyltransferase-3
MNLLDGSGLIDRYVTYSIHTRKLGELWEIKRSIGSFEPDLLVYLASRRKFLDICRDYFFFRLSGVPKFVGLPFASNLRTTRPPDSPGGLWESEAHRLARCVAPLGSAKIDQAANWDLKLSLAELSSADDLLREQLPRASDGLRLIGLSVGTKQAVKDWGEDNWRAALDGLNNPDLGLVLIGSAEERERSQEVARRWNGPILNFCGRTSPRVSAALIKRTELMLCHDSGPMHLAASVGTRCVAVFSKHNHPGQWFPFGSGHKILYPPAAADSIHAIRPPEVIEATQSLLAHKQ